MRRYTLTAPKVDNVGEPSGYPSKVRDALLDAGIDGWTEYDTIGWWRGVGEAGTTFEIYRMAAPQPFTHGTPERGDATDAYTRDVFLVQLARIGRACMPDQEAVQVTMDHSTITLTEG